MNPSAASSTTSPIGARAAFSMLAVGVFVLVFGLMELELNARIVLAIDGAIMCAMACAFGIRYDDLQRGIRDTIASMLVAMLILLAVGVLIAVWMASGTIPTMIYLGMQVITPSMFLPVVCIICTLMSALAGTSWGTLATVGVACMGVAEGLGVPLEAAAGAVCVGAFTGDKISPLSDSTVITATVTDTPLMEGIRHALVSTGPAFLLSLAFFFVYGLSLETHAAASGAYDEILATLSANFDLSVLTLLPVPVVLALIVLRKPAIPTFVAGIAAAALIAVVLQGENPRDLMNAMYSGYAAETGSSFVDTMVNRGGFTSMLGTIGLLMAAAIFGAPLRTAGVADVLLAWLRERARTSRSMSLAVMVLHAVFFTITGAYYVSYPVIGAMTKDLYPEYGLSRKNLMRTMLDTGTGLAPMVPWSTTGSYTAGTLGVANMAFIPFAPMLWLSILFSVFYALTGLCTAKYEEVREERSARTGRAEAQPA